MGLLAAAFLALLLGPLMGSDARPCPFTAVLMYSPAHGRDYCVCEAGAVCAGSLCTHGVDLAPRNLTRPGSIFAATRAHFGAARQGFPVACTECTCKVLLVRDQPAAGGGKAATAAVPENANAHAKSTLYKTKEGRVAADYPDPLFLATCNVTTPNLDGLPHPVALRNASWLHFPK